MAFDHAGGFHITGPVRMDCLSRLLLLFLHSSQQRRARRSYPQLRFGEITAAITGSIYREYLSAFSSLYGNPKEKYEETGLYVDWILQNGSSVFLSPGSTFIEVYVRSPEATVDAILS